MQLSDMALSRQLGVSRGPVREALSRLETEGIIEQLPHVGAFVRRLNRTDYEELLDTRLMLECHAAERAATRLSAAAMGELGQIMNALRQACLDFRRLSSGLGADLGQHASNPTVAELITS